MAYIFGKTPVKRSWLWISALGAALFAAAGLSLAAQPQSSSGQSSQPSSTQSSSGQTTPSQGTVTPGEMHSSQDSSSQQGDAPKKKTDDKKSSNKKSNDKKTNAKNSGGKSSTSKKPTSKEAKKEAKEEKKEANQTKKDAKEANTLNTKAARENVKEKKAVAKKEGGGVGADSKVASAEPDKVLFDRAMGDIKKSRYTEGRLSLQTLINTYPDSEYLAKAKLAVADSYFKEGGTTNLTQSIQEYIDFQTFFPFLDEAAYAQMQVGMAHYKMMEKSDRDTSQAIGAEDAFQTFLLKYPTNPLVPQAEQHLREVQEVLADGQFKVASFYYVKQDYRASAARLVEVTDRYPLYSGSDQALWMLGNVYLKAKLVSKNEDDKNHWSDLAGKCFTRIARDYPLSKYTADAKSRLSSMGMPVPAADPGAVARMQKEQLYAKAHHEPLIKKAPMSMLKSNPDVSTSAHAGTPNLNPPTDTVSATDVLRPGAAGPSFGIGVSATSAEGGAVGDASSDVTPAPAPTNEPGMAAGATIISTGGAPAGGTAAPASASEPSGPAMEGSVLNPSSPNVPPSNGPTTNTAPVTNAPASSAPVNPPTPNSSNSGSSSTTPTPAPSATGSPNATPSAAPAGGAPAGPGSQDGSQGTGSQQGSSGSSGSSSSDSSQESSSKKKKGIKKLIPF